MIIKFLRHIRKQPKNIRNNYALGISATFTGLVIAVWFIGNPNLGINLSKMSSSEGEMPFANLIKQSKEQLASLKETNNDITSSTAELDFGLKKDVFFDDFSSTTNQISTTTDLGEAIVATATTSSTSESQYEEIQILVVPSATTSATSSSVSTSSNRGI